MSFEFFVQDAGTFNQEPLAKIFKKRIYLNRSAQRKYSLETHTVLLGFDKDKQQICIKSIDSLQPGSRSMREGVVSCKYFLDYFQISRPQSNLEVLDSLESDAIIIQLKEAEGT